VIGSEQFTLAQTYDSVGRLDVLSYPAGQGAAFAVRHRYGPGGGLRSIVDAKTQAPFWTVLEQDDAGNPVNASGAFPQFQLSNGVRGRWLENGTRPGVLERIEGRLGTASVQHLAYEFDARLNVASRTDTLHGLKEIFEYDRLNRLERWTTLVNGQSTAETRYEYDPRGSLSRRNSEAGNGESATYAFAGVRGAGPYGVTDHNGGEFGYDSEGNQTSAPGRVTSFTSFGLPGTVEARSGRYQFAYDGTTARVRKTGPRGIETITLDGLYERRAEGSEQLHIFTIQGPEGPVAQLMRKGAASAGASLHYFLLDQYGSIDTITDALGKVVEVQKFSPFGRRMDPSNPGGPAPARKTPVRLGFTGHEHDDDLGLINMRGRLYDPGLGRFISPDPVYPDLTRAIGLNSYAYAANNPMRFIDPSGLEYERGGGGGGSDPFGSLPPGGCSNCGGGVGNVRDSGARANTTTNPKPKYNANNAAETRAAASRIDHAQRSTEYFGPFTRDQLIARIPPEERIRLEKAHWGEPFETVSDDVIGRTTRAAKNTQWLLATSAVFWVAGTGTATAVAWLTTPALLTSTGSVGALAPVAVRGFQSFAAFKRAMGPAGPGQAWHHIVEQTPGNVARFGPQAIHSTANLVRLAHGAGSIHARISGLYSSIRPAITGSTSLTVRQWLSTQSFEAQRAFGLQAMENVGRGLW
jgi:RHS repeat-associated protein